MKIMPTVYFSVCLLTATIDLSFASNLNGSAMDMASPALPAKIPGYPEYRFYLVSDMSKEEAEAMPEYLEMLKRGPVFRNAYLVFAAQHGYPNIVKKFLDNGVDANARTGDGTTALQGAILGKNFEVVKLLIERGADVRAKLLIRGADVRARINYFTNYVIPYAVSTYSQGVYQDPEYKIIKLLLKKGADPNASTTNGSTALMFASYNLTGPFRKNMVDIIELLLKHGANPNAETEHGKTALSYAGGDAEVVKMLKKAGAKK